MDRVLSLSTTGFTEKNNKEKPLPMVKAIPYQTSTRESLNGFWGFTTRIAGKRGMQY
jgi:hypothetical protein